MYTDLDGLGKFKFKLPKVPAKIMKLIPKQLQTHPLAPTPVKLTALMTKQAPVQAASVETVAPAVAEPVTVYPTQQPPQYYPQPQPMPQYYPQQMPQYYQQPQMPQYYQQPQMQPMPQYFEPPQAVQPSAAALPGDYFPTELEYRESEPENLPMLTPYESAAMSQFGPEEDFMDTSAAYESEAGYLQGLGQETGSTGGWFSDLISTGAKAITEIQKAKIAAKAAKVPAPITTGAMYKPAGGFMPAFNLNTALMIGGLGLAGFLIFQTMKRKKR